MRLQKSNKGVLYFSVVIITLLIVVSSIGFFNPTIYRDTTQLWLIQTIGQDGINLFLIAPVLIIISVYAHHGNRKLLLLWIGVMVYLAYTFLIYCFSVRFNSLFMGYCWILGLSIFAIIAHGNWRSWDHKPRSRILTYTVGFYFIGISILFYLLWLSEIVPAIFANQIPEVITKAGLFTNPVHVIDLSLVLPGLFVTGILLIQKKTVAEFLVPVWMVFLILMDLTIAILDVAISKAIGVDHYLLPIGMLILASFDLILLMLFLKAQTIYENTNTNTGYHSADY